MSKDTENATATAEAQEAKNKSTNATDEAKVVETQNGFKIDPNVLASIRILGTPARKFEVGDVLNFTETGQKSKFMGEEYSIYSDGNGRLIPLNRIANFILSDDALTENVLNPDDKTNRCLKFAGKVTYLKDFMISIDSNLPKKLRIVDRIPEGSTQALLSSGETGELFQAAYKELGINTELEHFPTISLRKGKNAANIANWRIVDRIIVELVD